jgi:FAD/FMN-containing dehydrogenase
MQSVEVDIGARRARAGGGVTWGVFDEATQRHGLATTGGLIPTTGIAGFTLGGGLGHLMSSCGLACDNLLSAEVVTADGTTLRTDQQQHPDLSGPFAEAAATLESSRSSSSGCTR